MQSFAVAWAKIAPDGCRLCCGGRAQRAEIPRQQHVDVGVAMAGGKRLKRSFHVGERLDAIELTSADERGQTCPNFGLLRRGPRIMQRPDQILDRVAVHLDLAIIEIDAEPIPVIDQIGERLAHVGLARQQLALGADKDVELDDQRFGAFLPGGAAHLGRGAADLLLDRVERGNALQDLLAYGPLLNHAAVSRK